jgi:GT2 family glycosyltransferase
MDFDSIKVGFVNLTVGNWDLLPAHFDSILANYRRHKDFYIVPNLEYKMSLAAALNKGFVMALDDGCDYICYVADDAMIGEGAVEKLLNKLEEGYWFVGGTLDVEAERSTPIPNAPVGQENSTGGWDVFVLDPVIFEEVGFMDESFYPAYYEDNCWARMIDLVKPGMMGYTPINMYHRRSETMKRYTQEEIDKHHRYFALNQRRYFEMWGGFPGTESYDKKWNGGPPDDRWDALKVYGYFRG